MLLTQQEEKTEEEAKQREGKKRRNRKHWILEGKKNKIRIKTRMHIPFCCHRVKSSYLGSGNNVSFLYF